MVPGGCDSEERRPAAECGSGSVPSIRNGAEPIQVQKRKNPAFLRGFSWLTTERARADERSCKTVSKDRVSDRSLYRKSETILSYFRRL